MRNTWTKLRWTSLGYSAPEASLKRSLLFRARCPRCLLDSNFYFFFVHLASHIHLVHSIPSPPRGFQLLRASAQIFMCTVPYPGGCFPFAVTSYLSLALISLSEQSLMAHQSTQHKSSEMIPKLHFVMPHGHVLPIKPLLYRTWTTSAHGPEFSAV